MVPRVPSSPCGVQSPSGHVNSTTARNLRQIGRSGPPPWHPRPVHGHRRLPVQPEPPRHGGCRAHPDSRPGADRVLCYRTDPGPEPHRRRWIAEVGTVEGPVDRERLAEPRRPARKIPGRSLDGPPAARQLLPRDHRAGPQQHGRRGAWRHADDVHAEVHAVGEVHVGVPWRPEHHRVPRRPAPVRVRRGVALAVVGLHLGQPDRDEALGGFVLEHAAEQARRDLRSGPVEELPREQPGRLVRHRRPWPTPRRRSPWRAARRAVRPPGPAPCRRTPCGRRARRPR